MGSTAGSGTCLGAGLAFTFEAQLTEGSLTTAEDTWRVGDGVPYEVLSP